MESYFDCSLESCFGAGQSAGKFGANISNSHFGYFSTPERRDAWQKGYNSTKKQATVLTK